MYTSLRVSLEDAITARMNGVHSQKRRRQSIEHLIYGKQGSFQGSVTTRNSPESSRMAIAESGNNPELAAENAQPRANTRTEAREQGPKQGGSSKQDESQSEEDRSQQSPARESRITIRRRSLLRKTFSDPETPLTVPPSSTSQ